MSEHPFNLPDIGEGLSEGEIVQWHVAVGEAVTVDQTLVDVQTDKAVVEIPAPVAGVLTRQGGQVGDVLPVGGLLAVIETDAGPAKAKAAPAAEKPAAPAKLAPATAPEAVPPGRVRASPATRKLARELGVDLATVQGTGSRGQVTRADVEQAAAGGAPAPVPAPAPTAAPAAAPKAAPAPRIAPPVGEDRVEPLRGLRRQIANTMQAAWREVPHIHSMRELDATRLVAARDSLNAELIEAGGRISYLPLFVKAVVTALQQHPRFNASLDMQQQQIVYRHRYNIGIAAATPDGLVVPVVHDADSKSIAELAAEIETLAEAARARKVTVEQISHGTFTITNFGSYGGWLGTPIIRPPEVAIAGFGRIRDAVVPVDGAPAVRKVLPLVVSTDHRLNDGEHLNGFMDSLAGYLGDPVRLLGRL